MMLPAMMADVVPPRGAIGMGITLLQVAVTLTTYSAERTNPMEYSKFASIKEGKLKHPIPSKLGMFIIYAPATVIAYLYAFAGAFQNTSPAATLLFVHFLKRTLEVLCLHKYSGNMESQSAFSIATIYVLYTMLISTFAVRSGQSNETWISIGYGFFVIGILGNFYHHYLLASLSS
jgi:very-long-chain enoyl-CoA reductase